MRKKRKSLPSERKLLSFLKKKKSAISPLLILTHDFPDPDALASAYALQYLADHVAGIKTRIVYKGIIGRVENQYMVNLLDLPVHRLAHGEIERYSHVALVDTQPEFENNPFPENRKATLVIDQHASVSHPSADLAIIDTHCGATSVVLAKAMLLLKNTIPERLATALAYGIITDTLNLSRARSTDIIKAYLDILAFADMHTLARIQSPLHDKGYFRTLGHGIKEAQICQGLIVCHLGKVRSPDMVSEMADFLLSYERTKWALASGRFRNKLYVSLRTKKKDHSAAKILRACVKKPEDAGGHDTIAGGSIRLNRPDKLTWVKEERTLQVNVARLLKLKKGGAYSRPFKQNRG